MAKVNLPIAISLVLSAVAAVFSRVALLTTQGIIGGRDGQASSSSFEAQAHAYLLENPEALIESVQRLAGTLRINGAPSFVAGEEIARGPVDLATLQQLIATARAKPGG